MRSGAVSVIFKYNSLPGAIPNATSLVWDSNCFQKVPYF